MTRPIDIAFHAPGRALDRVLVVMVAADLAATKPVAALLGRMDGHFERAATAAGFTGEAKAVLDLPAPVGLDAQRLLVVGVGGHFNGPRESDANVNLGGQLLGNLQARKITSASVMVDVPGLERDEAADAAADLALGALLRGYRFDKYQTRKSEDREAQDGTGLAALTFHLADAQAADSAFERRRAVAEGVELARDLVNEPANVLGPVEFAARLSALEPLGIDVDVLDVDALEALRMQALLAVGQGSVRPSRVVVMHWHGAKSKKARPLCIIGKGVCFDTGGISIKPAQGMEDMKGDMGGAAAVAGLMHALARRKAAVNVVGVVGLVENMPSGTAQRPGDIVASMSGQTIEVINTDAEGRLVLADLITYAETRFKPKLIVDLATLTGAIMVALGKEYAGLFSTDDKLAADLFAAGEATGERVWRMPLAKAYDKLIDSKVADMKNIGGRNAGAVTAAQFLRRFVGDTPWAHLDVAGVAMDSNRTDISQSWASGWGVRMLDRMIADAHEK